MAQTTEYAREATAHNTQDLCAAIGELSTDANLNRSAPSERRSLKGHLVCGLCESRLLRHLRKQQIYWYCTSCRQDMPHVKAKSIDSLCANPFHQHSDAIAGCPPDCCIQIPSQSKRDRQYPGAPRGVSITNCFKKQGLR